MAVYIMHEIVLLASGAPETGGELTASVGVTGKATHCHERIRDHLEN